MPRYRLIFTPESRDDVKNTSEYYDTQLPGLGKIFRNEVKRQLSQLKQNPFTRSIRYDNVRFAITHKFPYSIHYTINETKDTITIHGIICDYRDPMHFWKR